MSFNPKSLILTALYLLTAASLTAQERQTYNFDFDWKFSLSDSIVYSDPAYDAASWEDIQLPHDWNIGQEFDPNAGGGGSTAFLPEGIAWYRKSFVAPSDWQGRTLTLLFDGIFHQSDIYINGHHLGFRPYGFCSIYHDITPYLRYDRENVIAVRVDCTGERARWYAGAGIYRHAELLLTHPVHVDVYGTYITTPVINPDHAKVEIVTTVRNDSGTKQAVIVLNRILNAEGQPVAQSEPEVVIVLPHSNMDLKQRLSLTSPALWSIDDPTMYRMETTLSLGKEVVDRYETPFGVRSAVFDSVRGFLLNANPVKLKGVCLHFDAGALGTAVPDRSYERKLEKLKEYGCNAIRTGHHQPPKVVLDLCDRMGFVVIDEGLDKWKSGYYAPYFDDWWQQDLGDMILRDRNHPSVILWSIGNELAEAWDESNVGVDRARLLQDYVHALEPSRQVMLAAQNNHQTRFAGVTDVIGYNYLEARMLSDKRKFPERVCVVTEALPYFRGEEGRIRSYTPLNPWQLIEENAFVAGGFIWSGVDYLGEAARWPSKGWPNGLFDVCMTEKPSAAYHRAKWNPEPMVRIAVVDQSLDIDHGRDLWQSPKMAAHWAFPESYEGMIMEVRTVTNCETVRMYKDGNLMGEHRTSDFTNNTIVWYLPYSPGTLEAVGYNDGHEAARYKLITATETTQAHIHVDRTILKADGQDLSHIEITLLDQTGNPVQTDDREVTVTLEGCGRFLGIDNGDLRRNRTFAGNKLNTYFGKALVVVQSSRTPGPIILHIHIAGIAQPYTLSLTSE